MPALLVLLVLFSALAFAEVPCTHYASPTGQGAACTASAPCKVSSWWPLAGPGTTLCLRDGLYTGTESMITPPPGTRGTQAAPITVRAERDGAVTLDAGHTQQPVWLRWHAQSALSNDWFVIEGVNVTKFRSAGFDVSGSDNIVRRVIAYHGTTRDATIRCRLTSWAIASRAIDCAGWGMNMRKVFNMSQGGDLQGAGFQRCWGEWNDHTQGESDPTNTMQVGYNTIHMRWENVIVTWDLLGDHSNAEGPISFFNANNTTPAPSPSTTSHVLGTIGYIRPGANFSALNVAFAHNFNYAQRRRYGHGRAARLSHHQALLVHGLLAGLASL